MMVLGGYDCDIPTKGGKAFSHITTNRIISMTISFEILLNGIVLHMDLARSLITLVYHSISGTRSATVVRLRVDLPVIILLIFSNSLSLQKFSTYIPCL